MTTDSRDWERAYFDVIPRPRFARGARYLYGPFSAPWVDLRTALDMGAPPAPLNMWDEWAADDLREWDERFARWCRQHRRVA